MPEVDLSLDTIRRNLNWALSRDDRAALLKDLAEALRKVPAPVERDFIFASVAISAVSWRNKRLKPFETLESFKEWLSKKRSNADLGLFGVKPTDRRFEDFRELNLELLELLARRFVAEPTLIRAIDAPLSEILCGTMMSLRNVGVRLPLSKGMAEELWEALHEVTRMKCPSPIAATQLRTVINLMRTDYPVPDSLEPGLEAFYQGWKEEFLEKVPWWRNDFPPLGL